MHVLYGSVCVICKEDEEYYCGAAVQVLINTLWLEGFVFYQALQVVEGDSLHAETVPQWHKSDIPEGETILPGVHII